jgi:hypothetical protein
MADVQKWATLTEDGVYRYDLGRRWAPGGEHLLWVMLNPSTADAERDDATITALCRYSRDWGYNAAWVVNLFAYRATKPIELLKAPDPIGPENDYHIIDHTTLADGIVVAWGTNGTLHGRDKVVYDMLRETRPTIAIWCLTKTSAGHPHHPLRLAKDLQPIDWP